MAALLALLLLPLTSALPPACPPSPWGPRGCLAMGEEIIGSSVLAGGEAACRQLCAHLPLCSQFTSFKDRHSARHLCTLFSNGSTTECLTANNSTCWPGQAEETALLVVGGHGAHKSLELWSPPPGGPDFPQHRQCSFPQLKRSDQFYHTVDYVQGKIVICYGGDCNELTPEGPKYLKGTKRQRSHHMSHVLPQGLLLVGGMYAETTTELLPVDHEYSSRSQYSVPLDRPGRYGACSVLVSREAIVLIGGRPVGASRVIPRGQKYTVTEVTGLLPGQDSCTRRLPDTLSARYKSVCGLYMKNGNQMLVVAGGEIEVDYRRTAMDSTEVYDYTGGRAGWREAGPLPTARMDMRGGSLAGVLYLVGGYEHEPRSHGGDLTDTSDEVVAWDSATETWSPAGRLSSARAGHAVTEVPISAVEQYCTTPEPTGCDPGWAAHAGSCYQLLTGGGQTKLGARYSNIGACRSECTTLGGHLVSIHSAEENTFLTSLLPPKLASYDISRRNTWLGVVWDNETSAFTWEDGSVWDFNNWAPGEPDGGGGQYGCSVSLGGQADRALWTDGGCSVTDNSYYRQYCLCKQTSK